jgi:hypothetical protein
MGIGDDFANFKDKYNIPSVTIGSIAYRYQRITRQLNTDFWNTNSDLPYSVYQQYNAHQTNGQSALLQAVKRSIQKTYRTSESFGDGQVVVISFEDGITFEVLPAFENKDGQSWIYPNANNGGSWKVANPRAEIAAVSKRNDDANRNLKYLCRMMRIWRDHQSVPMSGMLIDTLAYQFIGTWHYRDKSFLYHDFMARGFFDYMSNVPEGQTYWRAPGSGSYLGSKGAFQFKARSAYLRAVEAINYNDDQYTWSRRRKWREIFGPLYPDS